MNPPDFNTISFVIFDKIPASKVATACYITLHYDRILMLNSGTQNMDRIRRLVD